MVWSQFTVDEWRSCVDDVVTVDEWRSCVDVLRMFNVMV